MIAILRNAHFTISCMLLLVGVTVSLEAKIVFVADGDICVMNDDGTGRRRLTRNTTSQDSSPRWSPDGKKIAFHRYMDKDNIQYTSELFIMNADGTDLQRLTDNEVTDGDPSWSPDGNHIVFTSTRNRLQVYVMEISSGTVRQLTGLDDETFSSSPDWSPDGSEIVFERFLSGPGIIPKTIYVMGADGADQHPLLADPPANAPPTFRFFPRWSPDGKRVLFYEDKWFAAGDVVKFVVQRIGGARSEIREINDRLGDTLFLSGASWMDGDRSIVFSLMLRDKATANYDLYRYTFATRGLRRLTREPIDEDWPDWTEGVLPVSPEGKLPLLWGELKQTYYEASVKPLS